MRICHTHTHMYVTCFSKYGLCFSREVQAFPLHLHHPYFFYFFLATSTRRNLTNKYISNHIREKAELRQAESRTENSIMRYSGERERETEQKSDRSRNMCKKILWRKFYSEIFYLRIQLCHGASERERERERERDRKAQAISSFFFYQF